MELDIEIDGWPEAADWAALADRAVEAASGEVDADATVAEAGGSETLRGRCLARCLRIMINES